MGSLDFGVTKELAMVEARIRESIVTEEPLLHDIARYVIESGGKRIRPMVTLLAFQALGGKEIRQAVDCAAAFELIHSATLIHDDINDGGEMRRGRLAADRKSTRLNSSHSQISYAVFCLKKKKIPTTYSAPVGTPPSCDPWLHTCTTSTTQDHVADAAERVVKALLNSQTRTPNEIEPHTT